MSRVYTDKEILSIFGKTKLHKDIKLSSRNWGEIVYDKIESYCSDWAEGCSKGVVFLDDADFVIKIPFNTSNEHNELMDFTGAINAVNRWDYCATEEALYKLAKIRGIEDCFLPVYEVGKINGYPIYKQPIGDIFACKGIMKYNCEKVETTTNNFYKQHHIPVELKYRLPIEWVYDVILAYPPQLVIDLLLFIKNNITDLHSANIGYYKNNPVIIDYAGFHECEYPSSYYDNSEECYSDQVYF